jgi:hypothetical protein
MKKSSTLRDSTFSQISQLVRRARQTPASTHTRDTNGRIHGALLADERLVVIVDDRLDIWPTNRGPSITPSFYDLLFQSLYDDLLQSQAILYGWIHFAILNP